MASCELGDSGLQRVPAVGDQKAVYVRLVRVDLFHKRVEAFVGRDRTGGRCAGSSEHSEETGFKARASSR